MDLELPPQDTNQILLDRVSFAYLLVLLLADLTLWPSLASENLADGWRPVTSRQIDFLFLSTC